MKKIKIKKIGIEDEKFPENLKNIKLPPQQLYVLGDENLLQEKCISIVGSRNCTEKGQKIAMEFAEKLSMSGLTIVSGMARGIDTSAHIGTLNAKGKTIAVLGAGFNHIFPQENIELFSKIINNGGAVVTEYDKNVKTCSKQFAERNRIVSGLSEAIFVVEAKERSGTSITADFARRQGKKIYCLAHGIEEKEGKGTNRLIKRGAKLVTCPEDILEDLKLKINISKQNYVEEKEEIVNVPEEYKKVYKYITTRPINIDELCKKTKLDMGSVNYVLTMLELEGLIKQLPGKNFVK